MSEQTPDTSNSIADGQEPSMEDILASIRKIIADDDVVAQDSSLDLEESVGLSEDLLATDFDVADITGEANVTELNAFEAEGAETIDLDILSDSAPVEDHEIEQLLTSADTIESETLDVAEFDIDAVNSEDVFDDILDLEIPMEDDESPVDITELVLADALEEGVIEDIAETVEIQDESTKAENTDDDIFDILSESEELVADPEVEALDMVAGTGEAVDFDESDDLALMLDDMLEDDGGAGEAIPSDDILEDIIAEEDVSSDDMLETDLSADETASVDEDADMNLVKSLMADLTEEPLHEEEQADDILNAELVSEVPEGDTEDDTDTDDVMDEILSMTLDDEIKLQDDISIPEIDETVETTVSEDITGSSALLDIAAEAEADASAINGGVTAGLGAAAIGVAALSVKAHSAAEIDTALADDLIPQTPETEMSQEETPDMARAAAKDTIIDEVTETATAGAFASLSNVVEEKAVVAERGDRVGDLVMEALRPMLKEWLDANLKGIVERAVTKEVKRISSGK